jgi:CO/xanthine dehydrogenase Mo-binding subunit
MKHLLILVTVLLCHVVLAAGGEISQDRAQDLASLYFARSFPEIGCGGALSPKKRLNYWAFVVAVGYAGVPSGTIRVDRTTGDAQALTMRMELTASELALNV